jgi:hypothetical protein
MSSPPSSPCSHRRPCFSAGVVTGSITMLILSRRRSFFGRPSLTLPRLCAERRHQTIPNRVNWDNWIVGTRFTVRRATSLTLSRYEVLRATARESGVFFRTIEHRPTRPQARAWPVQQPLWPIGFGPRNRHVPRTRTTTQQPRARCPQSVSTTRHKATAQQRLRSESATRLDPGRIRL